MKSPLNHNLSLEQIPEMRTNDLDSLSSCPSQIIRS